MAEVQAPAIQGSEDEVRQALRGCDWAFCIWGEPDATVWLVNPAFEELVDLPADQLVGRRLTEFVSPGNAVEATIAVLDRGIVDESRSRRTLRRGTGALVPVYVWARAVTVGGRRGALVFMLPVSQLGRAGRDPAAPWRSLATVVVGIADADWRVEAVSKDIANFANVCSEEVVGQSLIDLIEPVDDDGHDVDTHRGPSGRRPRGTEGPPRRGKLRCSRRGPIDVWVLYSPLSPGGDGRKVFTLVGTVNPRMAKDPSERVRELELRLQRIGAEVRAARIMDDVAGLPVAHGVTALPDLGDLSSRQWAILSRLGRGERVPQIAADLYLSQSTVRNHLSAIFQKFGVHSQSELLAKLRSLQEDSVPGG
jgi:DNA-binding CsgD family transcriptional regulator